MRFISWNVNGLRAIVKKNFYEVFERFGADLFAIQETKLQPDQLDVEIPGYDVYLSSAARKGYAGTAVFCREALKPERVLYGLGREALDQEGRITALDLGAFWFVNVYTPNSQNELARIDFRVEWDEAFREFVVGLHDGILPDGSVVAAKPVVICGDFNVAHEDIDLKNPEPNRGVSGFSDEERGGMTKLLNAGFVDTFRYLHPDQGGIYTWWSYLRRARRTNAGWRIDYFLVSEDLADRVLSASIYDEVLGSDHCPVGLELEI